MPKTTEERSIDLPFNPNARRASGGSTSTGGSGASAFLGLSDTPSSYSGAADKVAVVNDGETALEFGAVATPTPTANAIVVADSDGKIGAGWLDDADISKTFLELTDTPSAYTGAGGQLVKVKATEDGLEFVAGAGGAVDSVNGQTGVVVLDTDDIAEGVTNKYATAASVGAIVNAATADTPLDADKFAFWDVVDSVLKSITWANIKATLKTYFDTLYNLYVHPNHSGDVTSVGDGATTIANDVVTNAKLANMAQATIKGRASGAGTGDPTDLSAAQVATIVNSSLDHGALAGNGDDDHSQYALLAGRAGGQTVKGGTASGDDLTLQSTNHATKGNIHFGNSTYDEVNNRLGIGTTTPQEPLEVSQASSTTGGRIINRNPTEVVGASATFYFLTGSGGISSQNAMAFYRAQITQADPSTLKSELQFYNNRGDQIVLGMVLTDSGQLVVGLSSANASILGIKAGSSSNDAAVGGVLYVTTTQAGNVGGGEDTLASYTVPANTLAVNGQSFVCESYIETANNGNSKALRIKFGSTTIAQIALSALDKIMLRTRCVRTGAATQVWFTELIFNGAGSVVRSDTSAETLSGALAFSITAEAVSNNDIITKYMKIDWHDANS